MRVIVHPRVHQQHPEILDQDVIEAWENYWRMRPRLSVDPTRYEAVGFDPKGRLLEMVAVVERRRDGEVYRVFHALEARPVFLEQMGCTPEEISELGGTRHDH